MSFNIVSINPVYSRPETGIFYYQVRFINGFPCLVDSVFNEYFSIFRIDRHAYIPFFIALVNTGWRPLNVFNSFFDKICVLVNILYFKSIS